MQRGARVSQNDTIGYVGQTGWATGPHLHYEFRIAGQARNPFSIAMPAAQPVAQQDLPAFRKPRRDRWSSAWTCSATARRSTDRRQ